MANQEHLDILMQGVEVWNKWRKENPNIHPDLREADLRLIKDLSGAVLTNSILNGANLEKVRLYKANLQGANLIRTKLEEADLQEADLSRAILRGANLKRANLMRTNLSGANFIDADLEGADLRSAILIGTDLSEANLAGCYVYGVSTWDVYLDGAIQSDLVITLPNHPTVTVDDLEVAQLIYLLLNNKKIRGVIDTITSKVILILGRFTPERKQILDALREELRQHNDSPVVFDFEKPASKDLTETVSTLAHLARFVIVDLTDPSSTPHEVASIIPHCIVPVQPLILDGEREYSMFRDLRQRYHWVLPTYRYQDIPGLLSSIKENVIQPAEEKAKELEKRKQEK